MRVVLWILVGVFALAVLVCVAVYIPAVQRFAIDKTSALVAEKTGWSLQTEQFRLRFPAGVSLVETTVVAPSGDTIVRAGRLRLQAALWPLLKGRVRVTDIALQETSLEWRDTVSGMVLGARIDALSAGTVLFDPAGKSLRLTRALIDGGRADVSIGGGTSIPPPADTLPFDWDIGVERFELRDFALALDLPADALSLPADSVSLLPSVPGAAPSPVSEARFDYRHIRVLEAGFLVRNFGYRAGEISAHLENLTFAERSGLRVVDGGGDFAMKDGAVSLTGFALETAGSNLKGSFSAGPGISDLLPSTPISVQLSGTVAGDEMALFAPMPAQIGNLLEGRTLTLDGAVDGTLDDVSVERLTATLPSELTLDVRGRLRSLAAPEHLSGSVTLDGEALRLDFLRTLIADTALRRRVAVPHGMTFRAGVDFSPGVYDIGNFALLVGGGRLEGSGRIATEGTDYDADIRLNDFPLSEFLPHDSLGVATGALRAHGRGFDLPTMQAEASLDVERLEVRGNDLGVITAGVTVSGGDIASEVRSRSEMLVTDITLEGRLERDTIAPFPISYALSARIDTTVLRLGGTSHRIHPVAVQASTSLAGTRADLLSGDLAVDVSSPLPLDSLLRAATLTGTEVERQLAARRLSADSLRRVLPEFYLTAKAGRGNFLYDIARLRGLDFRTLSADLRVPSGSPFSIDAVVSGIASSGIEFDTLGLHAATNADLLDYRLRLANRPTTATDLGLISISGSAGGDSLTVDVLQRNSAGAEGFDFGMRASFRGSTLRAEIAPDPTLGYERWTVRPGEDWVEYDLDGHLRADLRLESAATVPSTAPVPAPATTVPVPAAAPAIVHAPVHAAAAPATTVHAPIHAAAAAPAIATAAAAARRVELTTASLPDIPQGALMVLIEGLDLAPMLDLFPAAPDLGGVISSDLTVGFLPAPVAGGGNIIVARGSLGAKDFAYDSRRVGDIAAVVDFGSDESGAITLDAAVTLDGAEALAAKGTYAAGAIDLTANVPSLPLAVMQRLLPPETATLEGSVNGTLRVSGTPSSPVISGDAGFVDAKVGIVMTGTEFGISPERISLSDNRVVLRDWGLIAPNNQKLTVNGSVNMANPSAPSVDLSLTAQNFRFVDSPHIEGSQVYGRATLDAAITARGTFDGMRVRGDVNLDGTTNIVYILRSTQKVHDESQHIVQFVSFADSLSVGEAASYSPPRSVGVDMLVGVKIGEGLRATLSLDEVNENRVELVGGGDLTFSMNRQGDTRLAGRYTLSGGTLYYKPPVIPQKIFLVDEGSYVEWAGALAEPNIAVSATQSMDVRLDHDDGTSEDINFVITASVLGTLPGLDMAFDLAAPSNIAIQDQLVAMSDEGRMQQALSLLVYNQYTGPGVSSKAAALDARSQLNDFVSKEINQWARNNLRGVDFSMGIDTRSDAAGGSRTDYSYSVSKSLFSDRVKISVGGKVSDDAVSAQGVADNLLEDVTLEYRLTRRDNMFLKLYRYNTRESILEGEVTEMGGGFVIQKKMNRLGDIFRRVGTKKSESENR